MTDVPLTVSCSGDTMTTKAEQSPFTTTGTAKATRSTSASPRGPRR
jgi:hypothetical protein